MKTSLSVLKWLAALGLAASVLLQVLGLVAFAGGPTLNLDILHAVAPWIMRLSVIGLPALLMAMLAAYREDARDVMRVVLVACPPFLQKLRIWLLYYACVMFALAAFLWRHAPDPDKAHALLFGSAMGMAFHATCLAIFISVQRVPHILRAQRCVNGHAVLGSDRVCPDCGVDLGRPA